MDAGRDVVQPGSLLLLLLVVNGFDACIVAKDENGEGNPNRSARIGTRCVWVIDMLNLNERVKGYGIDLKRRGCRFQHGLEGYVLACTLHPFSKGTKRRE